MVSATARRLRNVCTAGVLFAAVALCAAAPRVVTDQALPDIAGRWRIVGDVPPDMPGELLITGSGASPLLFIDRHFEHEVRSGNYSIQPTQLAGPSSARWVGNVLVLFEYGNGGQGAAPLTPDREERLTVAPDGALLVEITDKLPRGATTTTHAVYRRVPVPESVSPDQNLLTNPNANRDRADWRAVQDATVEPCDGNPCFVVRNRATFQQVVLLPRNAAGKYVVMIGAGSSERIVPGSITGLSYLYGLLAIADNSRYVGHLQDPGMRGEAREPNTWVKMSGVFPVPAGAAMLIFQLAQGEALGTPKNGSASRFDDLGCYLYSNESDARTFVARWSGRVR